MPNPPGTPSRWPTGSSPASTAAHAAPQGGHATPPDPLGPAKGEPVSTPAQQCQLRRVRWAVRGTLLLGVAASVAANVLHARPDPVAQIIAAWPPLALLLTVE